MAFAMSAIIIGAIVAPVAALIVRRRQNAVTAADEIIVRITGPTADSLAGELTEATRSIEVITRLLDEAIEHDSLGRLLASHVESTIGVAHLAGRDLSLDRLIEEADHRLISAKQSAKGSIVTE
jgi:GGDEF domain-containing protein